jgi:hypothetical protein
MKKLLFTGLMIAALSTSAFASEFVATGKTHSSLGDYKIEKADKTVTINGEEFKAFVISYQNTPMKVTVAVKKDRKCKNFIVLSDKLSVQYVCNGEYFGVQKLDKDLKAEGYSTSDAALNRTEYFHQKLLTYGVNGELENTQMIAAYFPLLLNQEVMAAM